MGSTIFNDKMASGMSMLTNHVLPLQEQNLKPRLLELLKERSVFWGDFALSSGKRSNYYIDAKLTTLYPEAAFLVGRIFWTIIRSFCTQNGCRIDAVGGLTMGADPIALSVGMSSFIDDEALSLRVFSVRKEPKTHGQKKLIEGTLEKGDHVVIIDDVVTGGESTLKAIRAVEAEGCTVSLVIVLVDRQEGGRAKIEAHGHQVVSVFAKDELLER